MTRSGAIIWKMSLVWALLILLASAKSMDGQCLPGGKHKDSPSPEDQLGICQSYAKNACCSPEVIQDLSKTNDIYWNRCGSLSSRCEEHLQQLECFYRCSPLAAQWPHPRRPTAVLAVPLCKNFCDQWYDACKEDLTCARNWLTDWHWGPDGNNCSQDCLTYGQTYRDGKELCDTIWGDSLTTNTDPCECLTLTASGTAIATSYPHHEDGGSTEGGSTKRSTHREGHAGPGRLCAQNLLLWRLRNNMQKRSVFMEDVEGSGSGF